MLTDSTWHEGQRVMWLTKMKAAIEHAMNHGSKLNSERALMGTAVNPGIIRKIMDGGDALIATYDARRTPIQAG